MTGKFWLRCAVCGWERAPGALDYRCGRCGGHLRVVYGTPPLEGTAVPSGMWRYFDRLPLHRPEHVVTLGEGGTPLIELPALGKVAGVSALLLKSEHLNPTGSFKDRIASVGLSIAVERGLVGSVGTSSGNGGASAAAYGVRAGMPVGLFVLPDIAAQKLAQIRALGAGVWAVPELGQDAAGMERAAGVIAATGAEHGWFPMLTGGLYSPEAMEGANTIAFELVEQAPRATAVYVPVGGGGLLASIWHGYAESPEQLPGPAPRLVAVQPEGSATLRHALRGRAGRLDGSLTTSISGLQMAMLFDGDAAEAITATGGHLVEVGDEQILSAQRRLAREEGVLLEPAGAAALAGALADAAAGRLAAGDQVVLIGTGSGFKDVDALARLAGDDVVPSVLTEDIGRLLGTLVASCG